MPLGRYLEAGLAVGLGSDVAGGPDLSIFTAMRMGAYAETALGMGGSGGGRRSEAGPATTSFDWLRLGTIGGARALGLGDRIGSLEAGKEADLIVVDPAFVAPVPGSTDDDPEDLASRLIFRAHPDMVRGAWVRGRRLEGPEVARMKRSRPRSSPGSRCSSVAPSVRSSGCRAPPRARSSD